MIVGGIDPGITGGLAVVNEHAWCETQIMPVIDHVVDGAAVMRFFAERDVEFIVIEAVHSMPKQGVKSTFSFGYSAGQVRTVGQLICIKPRMIRPQEWKRAWGLIGTSKEASVRKAIELFPQAADQFKRKKDHGRAEAALMAAYHLGMHKREAEVKAA
jgi:hypothetical protein